MAGRPKKIRDSEILNEIVSIEGPATAVEIVENVDMKRSGMNKRLDTLVEEGFIEQKKVGANAIVYWLTDKGEEKLERDY